MQKEQVLEETKLKSKYITTIVSMLVFLTLLTITITTNITLAAFGANIEHQDLSSIRFGNIGLDVGSMTISNITAQSGSMGNRVRPGDEVKVEFSLENSGTAGVLIRFRLNITEAASNLDTSIFVPAITQASNTVNGEIKTQQYVSYTFDDGVWFVRRQAIEGSAHPTQKNITPDNITLSVSFNPDTMGSNYRGATLNLKLEVQAVQYANNGNQRDPALEGYDVEWP